jgi:hypothetical protein
MAKIIKLNESDLVRIVKRVINEEQKNEKNLNEGVSMTTKKNRVNLSTTK